MNNDVIPFLQQMVRSNASDLFFSVGAPPNIKMDGVTAPFKVPKLAPGDVKSLAYGIMTEKQIAQFEATLEMNFALHAQNVGRFRVNVYQERGETAMVIRYVRENIPTLDELGLPPLLGELVTLKRGLVLIVGATGSGKTTALASMIDYRNSRMTGHVLSIEDPIEFIHHHKKSVVDQREIGIDTRSYAAALENAMRQAPDLIAIGEIRNKETMQHALAYADTGHLCISTMHASNANQAIERIINFFPQEAQKQLLLDLGLYLRGVVSLRLMPSLQTGLVPAVEIMLLTSFIAELIQTGRVDEIKAVMARSDQLGMVTFDQSLYALYKSGRISADQALLNADSKTDLKLRMKLAQPVDAAGNREDSGMWTHGGE